MNSTQLALTALMGLGVWGAQHNPFEEVPPLHEPPPVKVSGPTIEAIEFRGARRIPQSILRAVIASRPGGAFDNETLRRDVQALYQTGRFSEIALKTEPGRAGAIVRFMVEERPFIEEIDYQGDTTLTTVEIQNRLEERKINLRVDTLLHHDELARAVAAIQEQLAEKGRRNVTVTPVVAPLFSPGNVRITFVVDEK